MKASGQVQWITPVIPATQEVEIGKIVVENFLGKKMFARPHLKQ
jgi:hypothetical protein